MSSERPIIFSAPMVRAILDGRKTQTRRVIKLSRGFVPDTLEIDTEGSPVAIWRSSGCFANVSCPYGQPGDLLRVKETWRGYDLDGSTFRCEYRADDAYQEIDVYAGRGWMPILRKACREYPKWRPSIFMPVELCRLRLPVTDVRVERVREISASDCIREGVPLIGESGPEAVEKFARDTFSELWDSINAKRGFGWEANPLVRVIEFERVSK